MTTAARSADTARSGSPPGRGRAAARWLMGAVDWRRLPPTTRAYLILTGVVGLAAYNTLNNLLYIVAGLMIALLVVSAVLARWSVRGLRLVRGLPHHLYAGEAVDVTVTLTNTKRHLGAFALTVEDAIDGERTHESYMLALPPGDTRTVQYAHTFARRGAHVFDTLTIRSAFPFGLFPRRTALTAPQRVVVYPHIDPVDAVLLTALVDPHRFAHLTRGTGVNLYGIREYCPGDDARHISWKLSAKAARLLLREFETEQSREIALIFDNALPAATAEHLALFEAAVRLTASLAAALTDEHCTVRLITRSGRGQAGRGQQHLYGLLYELALITPVVPDAGGVLPGLKLHDVNPALSAVVLADAAATWPAGMRFPIVLFPGVRAGEVNWGERARATAAEGWAN